MYIQNKYVLILMLVWGNVYAQDLSNISLNSQNEAILEAIQRDEYLSPQFTYESSISNFAGEKQCICMDYSLHNWAGGRSQRAFKWAIDVPIGEDVSARIKADITKLDALVAVELLEKKRVSIKLATELQTYDRYRLTVKGWAASIKSKKGKPCFYLGRARHLSVVDVKEIEFPIGRGKKEKAYQVVLKAGFPKELKLPEWANNSEVRKAFPLINKLVNGYERKIFMEYSQGQWKEYLSPSQVARMKDSGFGRSEHYYSRNEPVTKRETMVKTFSFQEHLNPVWSCIGLPGESTNGLKVDKILGRGIKYSVVIFDNKVRSKRDDIDTTTKPYLERLVSSGLLVSHTQTGIEGERKNAGKYFNGTVYRLAPEYQKIIDPTRDCIFLGKGKVNIVDLKMLASNTRDNPFGKESFKYKYIMMFPDPPMWAKDRVLQAWWSDLKGALKYGFACEGKFEIDLTRYRYMGPGTGSCWWAYDSVAEL